MSSRSRVKAKASGSVIDWIRESSPEDIADALIAVDEAKAVLVVVRLTEQADAEARRVMGAVSKEMEDDPVGTLVKGILGGVSRISRGR
jgi:prolyl-tRNA editing enzyme YbaK/EbsC (Cys-tRNA(Pro) deacylase)